MPDTFVSFVFSLLLAAGAVFYVVFLQKTYSAPRSALAFVLCTATSVAIVPFYGTAVCPLYFPLWAGGYLGGITTVLASWVTAQAVAYVLGVPPVCWWSSLLLGLLGYGWSLLPLCRGGNRRLVLAASAVGLFLLWPIGLTVRFLLMFGVFFLMLFAWQLEDRSIRRTAWQRYLCDRGLVILYSSVGEVMMESAALQRDNSLADALKRHAHTHFHEFNSVVPVAYAGRHLLITISRVPLPTGEVGRMASFQDVTQTRQAVSETAQFFALTREGLGICTATGQLILTNQALEDMLGLTAVRAKNPCAMDFVHPDEGGQVRILAEGLRTLRHEHVRAEIRLLRRGGEYRWSNVAGVCSEQRDVICFVVHDTHERYQREQEMTESYRREVEQTKMLAIVEEAIMVFSLKGGVRYRNRGASELYGYSARSASQQPEPWLLATRYPKPLAELIELACQAGSWQGVLARTTATGETKLVEVRWTVLRDESGALTDIIEVSSDVSTVLRDSRRRQQLAAIVESTDDAVVSLSQNGEILTYNSGAEQMCGYSKEEVCGRPFLELVAEEKRTEAVEALQKAAKGSDTKDCGDLSSTSPGQRSPRPPRFFPSKMSGAESAAFPF